MVPEFRLTTCTSSLLSPLGPCRAPYRFGAQQSCMFSGAILEILTEGTFAL